VQLDHRIDFGLIMPMRLSPAACSSLRLFERRAGETQCADLIKRERYRIQLDAEVWINEVGLTPVTTAVTPSDGAMADNTVQDGILGSAMRAKISTTGTYSNNNFEREN
jgi:hypothetical protein